MLTLANTSSSVGLQNRIGHPAHRHRRLMQVPVLSARGIEMGSKTCAVVHHSNGIQTAPVALGGSQNMCCINSYAKQLNTVVVAKKKKKTRKEEFVV